MIPGAEFLRADVVSEYSDMFTDPRNLPADLVMLRRIPRVPASDGEIVVRSLNRVLVADIVADDQRALTYRQARIQADISNIPNIKHGTTLTQEDMNKITSIREGAAGAAVREVTDNLVPTLVQDTQTGVLQRAEILAVAMVTESSTLDRHGIKMKGVSFGMPADLNVTVSTAWTDAANATPVNDILAIMLQASVRYGVKYDRITMSSQAFRLMIATAEFKAKAPTAVGLPLSISIAAVPLQMIDFWKQLAQNILGVREIEFYDARFFVQAASGETTSAPYWPINKVGLSVIGNDGNRNVMDFGNAVTQESQVAAFLRNEGTVIGDLPQGARGPMSYATVPPDMNPPTVTFWSVMRGFPRKKVLHATACLTVGTFSDQIPIADPYI